MEVLLNACGQQRVKRLLLLYLFVLKATADCPRPQGRGNMVLSDKTLLMNEFPEGITVTLECVNGYLADTGSGIITCIDGKWTELDLTCKKKDCGLPTPQPNMSFNTSDGTLFGVVITVVCDKGYQISGSSFKQCYARGWLGRAKCEIVTCDEPSEVTNGRSSWDSQDVPKYGEIIRYTCNEGYTLIGKDSIMCSETGEYDSSPPECKGLLTPLPLTTMPMTTDRITTKIVTPSTTPAQEASTLTAHGEKSTTTGTAPTVLPSVQDKDNLAIDTTKYIGDTPVGLTVTVLTVLLAVIIGIFLYKFLLKRKGSYDTREDLKPELLQFQNL